MRIDLADWLRPYAADQAALARYLARLLPPGRLRVQRILASPQPLPPPRGRRAAASAAAMPSALPGATVLLLSDLGAGANLLGPPPAPPAEWRQWARQLRRRGQRVLALSPRPDAALARATTLPLWHWHEGLRVQTVWHRRPAAGAPGPGALALALLAMGGSAPDVDAAPDGDGVPAAAGRAAVAAPPGQAQGLNQALDQPQHQPFPRPQQSQQLQQLQTTAATAAVAQPGAAHHALAAARRAPGCAATPAARCRSRLLVQPSDRAARARTRWCWIPSCAPRCWAAFTSSLTPPAWRWRCCARPGRAGRTWRLLEEQLAAAELQARLDHADGTPDEATLAALLAPALKTLAVVPGPRGAGRAARELAGWAVHAWQRLSPTLQASDSLRQLAFAAARHLGSGQALVDRQGRAPPLPAPAPWLLPPDDVPQVAVAVELRRYADGSTNLVIGPAQPPTTALHRITLPLLGPLWLEVGGGQWPEGAEPHQRAQVVAIDPTRHTQIEVPPSHGQAPLSLRALGGAGWLLWAAGSLDEATQGAWLSSDAGLALLMLDSTRALLWPGEVVRRDPDRVLAGLAKQSFHTGARGPLQLGKTSDAAPADGQATRVHLLGPLPFQAGLVAVQVLDLPPGCVPLDDEARLPTGGGLASPTEARRGRRRPRLVGHGPALRP